MFFTVFVHLQFFCYDRMVHNYLCHQCLSPLKSSNPIHGEVYSIQHYVIKFVTDSGKSGFLWVLRFPPPIKLIATI